MKRAEGGDRLSSGLGQMSSAKVLRRQMEWEIRKCPADNLRKGGRANFK